jgi:hypothetical protein
MIERSMGMSLPHPSYFRFWRLVIDTQDRPPKAVWVGSSNLDVVTRDETSLAPALQVDGLIDCATVRS